MSTVKNGQNIGKYTVQSIIKENAYTETYRAEDEDGNAFFFKLFVVKRMPEKLLNPETGKNARIDRYRLKDNYTRFYLRCVEPRKNEISVGGYRFASVEQLPGWDAIMGLAFENLIVNNWAELLPRIGVGNAIVESAAPYRRFASNIRKGVQIDLLIQTPRTAYAVEIKRKSRIGQETEEEMEEKIKRLKVRKGMSVRPVLVYDGTLDPQISGRGYFAATIDAATLLEK